MRVTALGISDTCGSQAVQQGSLEGGTCLVQTEIAQTLGVSTTPLREALRDLATEGLVHLDAHRGGIVNRLTFQDLLEIHDLCRLVEPAAMRQVVTIATADPVQGARPSRRRCSSRRTLSGGRS